MYAVVGQDRLLQNDAVAGILRQFAEGLDELGPTRLDGSESELAEVLDEVRTLSLLGGRRVVILEDADPFITAHRQALERYCSSPCEGGCLILMCKALPRSTRLYKIISQHGAVLSCESPKGRAVIPWIQDRAGARYGKRLSAPGARLLREQLGDAPGILDAELAKLAAYVGGRPEITPADIDALTGHHREEKVFAVIDAMSSGDTTAALRNWEQVYATDRAAPGRAIAGLAWGVRRLLQAHRDWVGGANLQTLARRTYTDPGILERRLKQVTAPQLEEQQRDLLAADLAVKTGASTVQTAVEKFIVKHSVGEA